MTKFIITTRSDIALAVSMKFVNADHELTTARADARRFDTKEQAEAVAKTFSAAYQLTVRIAH